MPNVDTPLGCVQYACDSALFLHPACPFKTHLYPGLPNVVVIVGENASGKSLLFRVMQSTYQVEGHYAVHLSIRERTGSGTGEMDRLRRAMIYGDEAESSTGAVSASVARRAFHNATAREGHKSAVVMLDEPELGLSEGYAHGLGEAVGLMLVGKPSGEYRMAESCQGAVIVTHSREFVRGLMLGMGAEPSFLYAGQVPKTLQQWLDNPERLRAADLDTLYERGVEGRRAVHRIIEDVKLIKEAAESAGAPKQRGKKRG